MSTASANTTGLPDRRHFLSTLAAAGALGLPALPAIASPHGPIEAMYPEYLRLEAALDRVTIRIGDAEELYEEPERPRWNPFHEEGGYTTVMTSRTHGYSVLDDGPENIAYLRDRIAREWEPDDPDQGSPNNLRARRARKTLAKIEAWHAEVKRRKDAAGLTEAEAVEDEVSAERGAHLRTMFSIEATTYRELAFLAAVLTVEWQDNWASRVIERLADLAGVTPHTPV